MKFGERLRELRKINNLSQLELGKLLNMSKMAISHWEKGNSEPSIEQLKTMAMIFEVSVDYLIGYVD